MASANNSVGSDSVFSVVIVSPSTCSLLVIVSCPLETVLGLALGVMGDFAVSGELLVDDGDWGALLASNFSGAGVICARTSVEVSKTVQKITNPDIKLYLR
jgi:hypothetical protein